MGVTSVEMMKPSSVKSLASSSSVRSSWIVSTRPASVEVAMMLYFGMFELQFRRLLKTKGACRWANFFFSAADPLCSLQALCRCAIGSVRSRAGTAWYVHGCETRQAKERTKGDPRPNSGGEATSGDVLTLCSERLASRATIVVYPRHSPCDRREAGAILTFAMNACLGWERIGDRNGSTDMRRLDEMERTKQALPPTLMRQLLPVGGLTWPTFRRYRVAPI